MTQNVLITGASGCVGHYVVEELAQHPEFHLFLLVRNPAKLRFDPTRFPNLTILQADLGEFENYQYLLPEIDYVVSLAAAWGDPKYTERVNTDYPLYLYEQLNPERCKRILHFFTASILDSHNHLLPEAETIGTDYIRSKYLCYQRLPQSKLYERIVSIFPTLIFGGGKDKPYSHVSSGVPEIIKWFSAIQWLRCDASFHFIHAQDIATIVAYLLSAPKVEPLLVLGNPNITVNECIERASTFLGKKPPWTYQLTLAHARHLVKWLPISMAPWD
jgi:nucleoside-diphosphate-sugar epimerase